MSGDPIGELIVKIVMAFIGIFLFIMIAPAALGMFGIVLCPSCDAVTTAFIFAILPTAAVFAVIYFTWSSFSTR